jgi:hypothetical protein
MNSSGEASFAVVNIGGAEIIAILVLLVILGLLAVGFVALIYLVLRAVVNRPAPLSSAPPPEVTAQSQQRRDREHVKLLAIFHFLFAALALVGVGFLGVHYAIMHSVFSNQDLWKSQQQVLPSKAFFDAFIWFYLFMGAVLLTGLILNALSGLFLLRKRNRVYSLIIGGLNCLQIPFGTALGVFTILVLSRESVRQLYLER